MSKPDDGLRPIFRQYLIPLGFDMQSVETGGTGRGVPDTNYCVAGNEGWIEFKATSGYTVGLRPEQVGWIARRTRAGGRVWVAVRRRHDGGPRLGPPADELYLIPGRLAVVAQREGLKSLTTISPHTHGPTRWDWQAVAYTLQQQP